LPTCAVLVLTVLSTGGERFEARYPEGSQLVHSQQDSFEATVDDVTLNGASQGPEALEEFSHLSTLEERTIRYHDTVLAATEGRPTRVRRVFDELRKHTTDNGQERDEVGPLEGKSVLASEQEGTTTVEIEDDGDEVDEAYLADHPVIRCADYLLPDEPVEVGDDWQLDEDDLRRFTGMDSSPLYFESDLDDKVEGLYQEFQEGCTVRGKAEFAEIVERDGVRCALVEFEVELELVETKLDDLEIFGIDEDDMEFVTGAMGFELGSRGKLWYALAEGRPVAMEMDAEGTIDMRMEIPPLAEGAPPLEFRVKGTTTMGFESSWEAPE
jgi:hypothetical protein